MKKPELLAPAGGMDALKAAVQSGADAVYLGLRSFNARSGAENFDEEALNEAVRYCHVRGVQVHVTLNTIVQESETAAVADSIRVIASAGADAVIVQDPGVARMLREMAPDVHLHASTQMAVQNLSGVRFLAERGFSRVVLARELSLEDIAACGEAGVETEVFVHGALCVSCSGQCLFSSLVGARSANRGRCAQPCRLPYSLCGTQGHLLSPRDLCLLQDLDALTAAGVTSFKIEGRLKSPSYVAAVVSAYRKALDDPGAPRDIRPLLQAFNRGNFCRGYVFGFSEQELMYPEKPGHLGVPVGLSEESGRVKLTASVRAADALILAGKSGDRPVRLEGGAGDRIPAAGAVPGDALIRMTEDAQIRAAEALIRSERPLVPLRGRLEARAGQPARLTVTDGTRTVTAASDGDTEKARTVQDAGRALAQIRKTGGTPYFFEQLDAELDPEAFLPASQLNALRRRALELLSETRAERPVRIHPLTEVSKDADTFRGVPELRVQSGEPAVLAKAAALGAGRLLLAPEDLRAPALEKALAELPERFALVLPMALSESELRGLHAWASAHTDRISHTYLTNVGQLAHEWPGVPVADWPMNIANLRSLKTLRDWGCDGFVPSVELNVRQLRALPCPSELVVFGRIPLMQLKHCPLRAVRDLPGRHAACRACDGAEKGQRLNEAHLTDRKGVRFPLRRIASEAGCTAVVLNAVPLMLLSHRQEIPRAEGWRLICDSGDDMDALLRLHALAAEGRSPAEDPRWEDLRSLPHTTGHYFRGVDR